MPHTLRAAIESAQSESPAVVRAAFREMAARHQIDLIRGELLPELQLEGSFNSRYNSSTATRQNDSATIGGRLTVPLYQGGEVFARIRAAKRTRESLAQEIEQARVTARSDVVTAWSQLTAARARRKSALVEVRSNQIALQGVRAEERVGQRTLLDVLDAKQELLVSQSSLVTTRRDIIVAAYTVLSAIGRLAASDVALNVSLHDPEEYYDLVRPKFWGATVTPNEDYEGYGVLTPITQ